MFNSFGLNITQRFPGEVVVNRGQIAQSFHVWDSYPTLRQIRNVVTRGLTRDGILRYKGTRLLENTYDEDIIDNEYHLPLVQDAVDTVNNVGLLPVKMMKVSATSPDDTVPGEEINLPEQLLYLFEQANQNKRLDDDTVVPVVPHWESYEITFLEYRGRRVYRFWWLPSDIDSRSVQPELDPTVVVYDLFGFSPDIKGNIRSPVSTVLPGIMMINKFKDCALNAEVLSCNPLLILEDARSANGSTISDRAGSNAGGPDGNNGPLFIPYAEGDQEVQREQDMWRATGASVRYVRTAMAMLSGGQRALAQERGEQESAYRIDNTEVNQLPIPAGRRIGRQVLPQTRNDLTDIERMVQEEIFSTFGVPRSKLMNDQVSARYNSEGMNETYNDSLMGWKDKLDAVLTDIHRRIDYQFAASKRGGDLNDDDDDDDNNVIVKTLREKKAEVGGDIERVKSRLLPKLLKENQIRVELAITPKLSSSDILMYSAMGYLKYEDAGKLLFKQNSLAHEGEFPKRNPLTPDDMKQLIGIKPMTQGGGGGGGGEGIAAPSRKRKSPDSEGDTESSDKTKGGAADEVKQLAKKKKVGSADDKDGDGDGGGDKDNNDNNSSSRKDKK